MELKKGMYVRTKLKEEIVIRKIIDIRENPLINQHLLVFDKSAKWKYYIEDNYFIAKNNLIDLIEVGDYVNGILIETKYEDYNGKWIIGEDCGDSFYDRQFEEKDIKSIVTKEQFKSIMYEVGE